VFSTPDLSKQNATSIPQEMPDFSEPDPRATKDAFYIRSFGGLFAPLAFAKVAILSSISDKRSEEEEIEIKAASDAHECTLLNNSRNILRFIREPTEDE